MSDLEFDPAHDYEVVAILAGDECEALLDWLDEPEDDDPVRPEFRTALAKLNTALRESIDFMDRPPAKAPTAGGPAVDAPERCVECDSSKDVTYCRVKDDHWCDRCHVDEFGHSCEIEMEINGRKGYMDLHGDEDGE